MHETVRQMILYLRDILNLSFYQIQDRDFAKACLAHISRILSGQEGKERLYSGPVPSSDCRMVQGTSDLEGSAGPRVVAGQRGGDKLPRGGEIYKGLPQEGTEGISSADLSSRGRGAGGLVLHHSSPVGEALLFCLHPELLSVSVCPCLPQELL